MEALKALYQDSIPQRGKIKVELKKEPTDDNAGVLGCVISTITGATSDFGFGGIPTGKFNRRELLFFGADIESDVAFTDIESGKKVFVNYTPKKVVNPMAILKSAISKDAKEEDIKSFPKRFQDMVKTIFENVDKAIEIKVK